MLRAIAVRIKAFIFVLLALWLPAKANAAACSAGCLQGIVGSVFSGTSLTTSVTVATTGNSIRGIACGQGATSISGITVGGGAATLGATQPSGGGNFCALFNRANLTSGANSIVVTYVGTCSNCSSLAEEWANTSAIGVLDGSNGTYTFGASTSAPSGSFSTTGTDTIEAFLFQPNTATTSTIPATFTLAENLTSSSGFLTAFKTGVAAGSQNPAFTSAAGSFDNYVVAGGFTEVSAAVGHPRLLKDVGP